MIPAPSPDVPGAPGTVRRDWAIWAATRALLLVIIAGWIPWPEQVNDLTIYGRWAAGDLAHGHFPDDPLWQYPPLAGPVFLLGAALPGEHLGYALLFCAFDAAIMALVSARARQTGLTDGRLVWAAAPVITGVLLLARFDVVPTAFAVAAVVAAPTRPALASAVATLGAWLKVWPALVLAGLRRRDLPRGLVAAALTSVLVAGAMAIAWSDPFSFLTGQRERGLQIESIGAWPFLMARAFGGDVEVAYQYGAHEVVATAVPAVAGASVALTLVLLGVVAVQRLRGALETVAAADVALAAVLFTVVTSRVFSGQYFIWLLGIAAVCLADPRTRMRPVISLLLVAGVCTHLVYPWLYGALLAGAWPALVVQTVRVVCTVAAAGLALGVILRPERPREVRPGAQPGAAG